MAGLAGFSGSSPPAGHPRSAAPVLDLIQPDYVRLQVVAASDSGRDQAAKAAVQKTLAGALAGPAAGLTSSSEALAALEPLLPELRARADAALAERGCSYRADLVLGYVDFPAKSYGGQIVPPGRYPALRVTLGAGQGANWWCVMFPPLCFIDVSSSLSQAPPPPATDPAMNSPDAPPPEGDEGDGAELGTDDRVVIRSWLLDKLRSPGYRRWWALFRDCLAALATEDR